MAEPIVQDKDQGMTYLQLSQQSRSELRSKFEKYERPPGDSTLAGPQLQLTNMAGKYFKKYFHNFIFSTLSLSAFVFCAGWKIFFTSLRILLRSCLYSTQRWRSVIEIWTRGLLLVMLVGLEWMVRLAARFGVFLKFPLKHGRLWPR